MLCSALMCDVPIDFPIIVLAPHLRVGRSFVSALWGKSDANRHFRFRIASVQNERFMCPPSAAGFFIQAMYQNAGKPLFISKK
jgi:hypothetical protein